MARRKHDEEHESHERWLVSYADFITLLFAFFVVMYAISSVNEGKYRVLSDALVSAFRNEVPSSISVIQLPNQAQAGAKPKVSPSAPPRAPELEAQAKKMRGMAGDIRGALGPLIEQGKVRVTQSKRGIAVEISDSVLFDLGRAELQAASVTMLKTVAELVRDNDNLIQVEGHTDNQPIRSTQYPSNWELSAARAASVVRLFAENGIVPKRMVAIGYAEFRPVEQNETVEGRARNRRVTLNILADNKDEVAVLPPADTPRPNGQ
ncbi:flagellar motor protein MotD [Jeongeupia chitinilytica]|uniref:Flagellar motor protein MotD n=1 Tax=Jeongeupia chitinilytica TaxID=1041641 RepID=A0ABQ3GUU7_9NEIS|nr:flagellar motor protein MotD [Jeongeupia chitinilytica]GHD56067.1 flagellar motor protein MotD [Jeongeupia chitinilytica]